MEAFRTRSKRKRYFGMTGTQVGILVVMGVLACTVLSIALALLIEDMNAQPSSAPSSQPTYVPLSTDTPFPTSTPRRRPPTWTLTPKPQYTPTRSSTKPTSTIDSTCLAFNDWNSSTTENIQEYANIMNAFSSQDPNHVDFHFVRTLANRMSVVAMSQSNIQVHGELADMNLLFVSGFELMEQAMSQAALGLETADQALINQSYNTADRANAVFGRAIEKWKSIAQGCGFDISQLP